jgi:hypothetical protein
MIMNLRWLVEKSADADLLRDMIGLAAEKLMALEVALRLAQATGKNPLRVAQRNGYRDRDRETRARTVELGIPRPRTGSYFQPSLTRVAWPKSPDCCHSESLHPMVAALAPYLRLLACAKFAFLPPMVFLLFRR